MNVDESMALFMNTDTFYGYSKRVYESRIDMDKLSDLGTDGLMRTVNSIEDKSS